MIDVRNPDGKLVTHREFENAYVPNEFLASLLVRHQSQGFWLVGLSGISESYTMIEPEYTGYTGGVSSNNLSVFPDIHDIGFTLSGSFTAGPSDTISAVNTSAELCPNTVAPFSACQNSSTLAFTGTSISPGVSFFAGQIVQVTVTITFS